MKGHPAQDTGALALDLLVGSYALQEVSLRRHLAASSGSLTANRASLTFASDCQTPDATMSSTLYLRFMKKRNHLEVMCK